MFYVKRAKNHDIVAIFTKPNREAKEVVPEDHPDILAFLAPKDPHKILRHLEATDLEMIRIIEDLVEILIEKNLITLLDFPQFAQHKILSRKKIREKFQEKLGGLMTKEGEKE